MTLASASDPEQTVSRSFLREMLNAVRDRALTKAAMVGYRHAEICDGRDRSHQCAEVVADDIRKILERLRGDR